jgi:hypothetical protein
MQGNFVAKKLAKRPARPAKDAALSFRLPAPIRDALDHAAAADDRTVSAYVTRLLDRHLREAGFLK